MNTLRRSLIFSYISKYITTATQLVTSIVLARLLTPEDIGIYTVAAVFVGLGYLLREFGINTYIVQEKELTDDRIRAAFTLNLIFSWGIALILFIFRGPIGDFYSNEAVHEVIGFLCINFMLIPFGAITFAYIRREMRFKHTMVIQVGSSTVSAIVAIFSAYHGEAYLSLVWSAIAGTATSVLLTFAYRSPGLPTTPGFSEIPHVLAFCKYAGPSAIITHLGRTAPDWILGKAVDMSAVGLFSRATGTINMFNTAFMDAIWGVTLPHFSKQHREGGIDTKQYLVFVTNIIAIAWPFFVLLAIYAEPVVVILFGNQWIDSVPALQILCIDAILLYTIALAPNLIIATGQIKLSFVLNLITQISVIAGVIIFATNGIVWVAIGIAIAGTVRLFLYQIATHSTLSIPPREFFRVYLKIGVFTFFCTTPLYITGMFLDAETKTSILTLTLIGLLSFSLWLALLWIFKIPLRLDVRNAYMKLKRAK